MMLFRDDHGRDYPVIVFAWIKPLNLLMLGDGYARNLGLNINRAWVWVITCAGVLTAIVTAYCGPIIFLGVGGTSLVPGNFPDIRSPGADAGLDACRGIAGVALQLDCPLAGIRGCATREFRDGIGGGRPW